MPKISKAAPIPARLFYKPNSEAYQVINYDDDDCISPKVFLQLLDHYTDEKPWDTLILQEKNKVYAKE